MFSNLSKYFDDEFKYFNHSCGSSWNAPVRLNASLFRLLNKNYYQGNFCYLNSPATIERSDHGIMMRTGIRDSLKSGPETCDPETQDPKP